VIGAGGDPSGEGAPILTHVIVTSACRDLHQRGGLDLLVTSEAVPEPVQDKPIRAAR